jgi:single-stranded DNA-binding protein
MNSFIAIGSYAGDQTMDNGLRFMKIVVPRTGNSGLDVPLYLVRNRAAGENLDMFQPGMRLLLGGRLYPNIQDGHMYVVPNQPFQPIADKNLQLNRVNLFGGVGYMDESKEDLLVFSLMCSAPGQQILNHTWQDSLPFRLEAWGDDSKRLSRLLQKGRSVSIEGVLRYSSWQGKDGTQKFAYQVRVRSSLYGLGPAKKTAEVAEVQPAPVVPKVVTAVPLQQQRDFTPSSVNTDEIPF